MRVSLKTKILLLFTFVLTIQGISYFHHFYILKQELVQRWNEETNVLVSIMSDKLSSLLEEKVSQINTLIAKYERLGLSPEEVLWRLSGDIAGVSEGAFYDTSGRLLAFSSRLKTMPEFEKQLSSLLERVERLGYQKDSYGELYIRIKVPDFQDNVFKGFYVVSINLNSLLEDVYSLSFQHVNLYLLDSSGRTLLSLQHAVSKNFLRVSSPVKGTDWTLVIEEPYQTVLEPAYQFLLRAFFFGFLSTLGLGVIFFLVIGRIFKPLDRLKESLLEWNEKRRISLQGSDEIGMLSKTFEELVNRLEREKEVYMNIFNGSVDGMLLVSKEGKIKRVNKSFLERYSVKEEEIVGRDISQFLEHGSHQTLFIPEALLTIGSKRYVVNVCTVPINVEEGEFLLYQIRDLTEKKELELILYRTSKLSLAGEMACCMAHQLNNPLASILVYAEYIHNTVQDEKLREKAGIIMRQALKSAETVKKLLDMAKVFDGKPQEINPYSITREVIELLSFKARRKRVSLEFTADINTHAGMMCSSWKLEQVLINVIENAIDASQQGQKVEIKLKWENSCFVWTVRDYGEGIPEEDLQKVFEPFYTTKKDGTGLGLSLVKRFLDDMNGNISMYNTQKGLEVVISLPSKTQC